MTRKTQRVAVAGILIISLAVGLVWAASIRAQQSQRCTTSEWSCTQAGLPYTPLPALGALTRALTGEPELLRVVNSITTVPCPDLEINRRTGKTCAEADLSFAIVQADPAAGTITVARLLTGEPVGVVTQMLRAVCEIYTVQVWGDGSEEAIERCILGAR